MSECTDENISKKENFQEEGEKLAVVEPDSSSAPPFPTFASEQRPAAHDPNAAILEDAAFVRANLPDAAILTLTYEFVSVTVMRTPYARIQLRIQYTEKYPHDIPIVELSSPSLPLPLLRNKEKECAEKAAEHLGAAQFQSIYEHIHSFIHSNMFVPCWKEMKQVATLCEGKGKVSADDNEGLIQLQLKCGKYRQVFKIKVPADYPETGPSVEFANSNFPVDIQIMFKAQVEEIVRRCEAGFSGEDLALGSNSAKMLHNSSGGGNSSSKISSDNSGQKSTAAAVLAKQKMQHQPQQAHQITTQGLKDMKRGIDVLKQMSDLRVAATHTDSRKYCKEVDAEKREARKGLRRLAKAEATLDEALLKQMLEEEENEMKALMQRKTSDTAQPSLFHTVRFLVCDYVHRLPLEPCQSCSTLVLPEEPAGAGAERGPHRPVRTFCGHWLHHDCLDAWLTQPPFIRQCPVCDRRIWHPDWPEDHKQLEKAWQVKEARQREMDDVMDCF